MCSCAQKQGQTQDSSWTFLHFAFLLWPVLVKTSPLTASKPPKKPGQTWDGLAEFQDSPWQGPKPPAEKEPRTANLPSATLKMLEKFAFKELVELHLNPLELFTAPTAWKMNTGLSYLRDKWPNSARHQGSLLAHERAAEARWAPSCPSRLEFYYTMASQEALPSKHPGCHPCTGRAQPWADQMRKKGKKEKTWCKPRWNMGQLPDECGKVLPRNTPPCTKAHPSVSGQGLKYKFQLQFYLKDMGKHPAQNLLPSAPLCLEAEGVFAE